jgi:hypothetical protein
MMGVTFMFTFFSNVFPISEYRKRKSDIYIELGLRKSHNPQLVMRKSPSKEPILEAYIDYDNDLKIKYKPVIDLTTGEPKLKNCTLSIPTYIQYKQTCLQQKYTQVYDDLGEWSLHLIEIPFKLWTCFLLASINYIYVIFYFINSLFYFFLLNPWVSVEYSRLCLGSFGNVIYDLFSMIVDPMLALSCFLPRTVLSIPTFFIGLVTMTLKCFEWGEDGKFFFDGFDMLPDHESGSRSMNLSSPIM